MTAVVAAALAAAAFAKDVTPREERLALARELAAGGIVLLKNEGNLLPLKPGQEIALCGTTSYFCHRMGTGSGDMLARTPVQYADGLERAGVKLLPTLAKRYRAFVADKVKNDRRYRELNRVWADFLFAFDELPESRGDFVKLAAADRSMTAVVTIGRGAGENADIPEAPGGFRLSWQEELLLESVCQAFDHVVLLLNVAGVIDTSFLDQYPIEAVVLTSLLGEVSGDAVADVLTGKVNPSGRLVDTWAKRYCDYPSTDCFQTSEITYKEGIFVGYRHFDAKGVEVRFPFGYGLSYTSFEVAPGELVQEGLRLELPVTVRNTGAVSGADVLQVYLAIPSGKLAQAPKKLCAFWKTPIIPANGEVTHRFEFSLKDSASYCVKTASWVLESGEYGVLLGDGRAAPKRVGTAVVKELVVVEQVANRLVKPAKSVRREELVKRAKGFVTFPEVVAGKATAEDLVAQFTDDELVKMVNGRVFEQGAAGAVTGVGGSHLGRVPCEAAETWSSEKYALPAINCVDGPSGLRLSNFGDTADKYHPLAWTMVAWPSASALAQGWDVALAEAFGRAITEELELADIDGWLAPGVNIHRNPLCGRNFEYFSEDPLVAGKMGAAVVRGVQRKADGTLSGRYATVKHFCTNNQEFNRGGEMNFVDERTLREIYLKPFEIVVKEAEPQALMTSYNRLNGCYTAENADLLTSVLRGEWGFRGFVMTDWWGAGDKTIHPGAGNDIVMPGGADDLYWFAKNLKDGKIRRADLQHSAVALVRQAVIRAQAAPLSGTTDWTKSKWIKAPQAKGATEADKAAEIAAAGTSWFALPQQNAAAVVQATWTTTALGVYELYVNGKRVGGDFLKPGFTHPKKTRRAFTYDVTALMRRKAGARNGFAAEVSTGWWCDKITGYAGEVPAFRGMLKLVYDNGAVETIGTEPGLWQAAVGGPVLRAGIFDGEIYDARIAALAGGSRAFAPAVESTEFAGEILPTAGAEITLRRDLTRGFAEAYVYASDEAKLVNRHIDATNENASAWGEVVKTRVFKPGETLVVKSGETLVVDFAQNCAAIPSFEFKSRRGATLTFLPAEMLNDGKGERSRGNDGPGGSVYRDNYRVAPTGMRLEYTFATDGFEKYEPRFTFFGYRYAAVTATAEVEFRMLAQVPVSSITKAMELGSLTTGEQDVNKLIANVRWGQLSNYLSIPTDCPQRDERQGWTADTQVFCEAGSSNADTAAFFHKWLRDLRDTQRETGAYTGVAPFGEYGDAGAMRLGWADAGVIVPWTVWKQFGDAAVIRESWESMKKYVARQAATRFAMEKIIDECEDYQWADWLSYEPLESCSAKAFSTTTGKWIAKPEARHYWSFLGGCYWFYDATLMAEMAAAIGAPDEAEHYRTMAAEAKDYLKRTFFAADGMIADAQLRTMQTPAVFALKFGLVEGAAKEKTIAALRKSIADHDGCLQTGFLGTSFLMEVLTENGLASLAYDLLLQHKNPSWLYSVDQGATTIWERWNSYTKKDGFGPVSMNSFNHYAYGAVLAWIYKTAAGIAATTDDPGFKTIVMKPVPDRRLGHLEAEYRSAAGLIKSAWHYEGDEWIWTFTVPAGAKARVTLPGETAMREYAPGEYTIRRKNML